MGMITLRTGEGKGRGRQEWGRRLCAWNMAGESGLNKTQCLTGVRGEDRGDMKAPKAYTGG